MKSIIARQRHVVEVTLSFPHKCFHCRVKELHYYFCFCDIAQFKILWQWWNEHCPAAMNQDACQACAPYVITTCIADSDSCFRYIDSTSSYDILSTCPYTFCRLGFVQYVNDNAIWLCN